MKIIPCTKEDFEAMNAKALEEFRKNGGQAERWCNPIIHPETGEYGFTVEEKIEACLEQQEKSKKIDIPEDWRPPVDNQQKAES